MKKPYENLMLKYSVTQAELKRAIDQIDFCKIACSGSCLMALLDLICNGDIERV